LASKTQLERLREAERELETQLIKLRKRIRLAERGENRRIKDADKYIARTNKLIAKTNREQEKIQEKQLAKLERFLGDTFETLGEAREALTQQTRKATKRERLAFLTVEKEKQLKRGHVKAAERIEREITGAKLNANKQSYTIRQLSKIENQQVIDFLQDKRSFERVGLNYLKPNERITVSVPYRYFDSDGKTHTARAVGRKVFQSWPQLQAHINNKYFGAKQDSYTEDWLGSIEIIKFPDEYQYKIERGRQTDVKNTRRVRVRKYVAEEKRKFKQVERAKRNKLKAENKELKRQLKAQKKGR
jgi:uncharacterized protein YoxC